MRYLVPRGARALELIGKMMGDKRLGGMRLLDDGRLELRPADAKSETHPAMVNALGDTMGSMTAVERMELRGLFVIAESEP